MLSTRRWFLRGLVAAVAATTLPTPATRVAAAPYIPAQSIPAAIAQAPTVRRAQDGAWLQLGPGVPIRRLFAPISGALFAATADALLRSDDAGASWAVVALPPTQKKDRLVEVDPTDHRVIYVEADDGLQRSTDDTATWATILRSSYPTRGLAISPANPDVLYAGQYASMSGDFWFQRSLDRGGVWEAIEEHHFSLCGWSVPILAPHPTDPARIFRSGGCHAGRDFSEILEESRDNGSTWRTILSPKGSFPAVIVGGGGADPNRLYLSSNNDLRMGGGSLVFTSPDDGASWSPIMEHTSGGSVPNDQQPNITIGALTYDPSAPLRVFVGLRRQLAAGKPDGSLGVVGTTDGGVSWSQIGQPDIPAISHLVLGVDGQNLFAASEAGVWRIALG